MITTTRPVVRYYGGKWKIADWIISNFPERKLYRTYVEPFGGAGSVLVKKQPSLVEIYNDLSGEMVNLFKVLRCPILSDKLIYQLELTPWARDEWKSSYELSSDPVEQARRTIVLCSMSHNPSKALNRLSNGFRVSSKGDHRLPQDFQRYTKNIPNITARLKNVIIENRAAYDVCKANDSLETLHYLDPPYVGNTRSTNTGNFYQHEMRDEDSHCQFLTWAKSLEGYVVISCYDYPLYDDLLIPDGWEKCSVQATTGAASGGKSKATEVLYLNPRVVASNRQLKIFDEPC